MVLSSTTFVYGDAVNDADTSISLKPPADTEIILNAYCEFGTDSFKDLDGMSSNAAA
jgi:asparagine synthetase B (glutamine-hydrolysing)